ncbi:MAG: ABC transporter permease subunit [Cardiobacteriaceae bacterium]|nr:ABC transporter permease subunit [Cardiobacteriaceae bacterium]
MQYIFTFYQTYFYDFVIGTLNTIFIVTCSLFFGLILAIPLGIILANNNTNKIISALISFYSYIFRTTPMLLQLYLIYFGLGLFFAEKNILENILKSKNFWAIFSFSLNTAAYTLQIIKTAIINSDKSEIIAAKGYAFSDATIKFQIIFRQSLPSLIRNYSNEVIYMLHGSAIVSTIAVFDLTQAAKTAYFQSFNPYLPFISAALIYLSITAFILLVFHYLEFFSLKIKRKTAVNNL